MTEPKRIRCLQCHKTLGMDAIEGGTIDGTIDIKCSGKFEGHKCGAINRITVKNGRVVLQRPVVVTVRNDTLTADMLDKKNLDKAINKLQKRKDGELVYK